MSVLSREEYLETIRGIVGDNTDDETIQMIENLTDTFDFNAQGDGEDWKTRYETNDAEWRKKYTERFFSSEPKEPDPVEPKEPDPVEPKSYDDLFTND